MDEITRVGVDLAKRVYQVHAVDGSERTVLARPMSPQRFEQWAATLPAGCVVAMESCSGAHHLARRLRLMGLDARLIAAHFIAPFRVQGTSGKNDAYDAAAICEAASRVRTRCIAVKTPQQQGWQGIHRLREGYKEERTACINRIRGLLAEFGLVFPQSPDALRRVLSHALEDASNELPGMLRLGLQRAQAHWRLLDEEIAWCDSQVKQHVRQDQAAARAAQLHGVGELTASALVAAVGDMHQFKSARQFSAWLGLVPSQNSSGGKHRLGRITKRGNNYLRTLLIQGAKSALLAAPKRCDRISQWLLQLRDRVGWQRALVALANKNARILWAVLTRELDYDPEHVPPIPQCKQPAPTAPLPA
ncbi:IS110 family transposase [Roseateles sp. DAIF2]|uniref:IS110 family transposase n=1 Tax=Roseateles sp. DAIF2 TaxID=2714952 RepID=UPI0018A29568|nr:IS110 family transposase [Roseateles sp. DAIF2]QPF76574.1 IS110 family transposase [Roseateles sp. DAIF2]